MVKKKIKRKGRLKRTRELSSSDIERIRREKLLEKERQLRRRGQRIDFTILRAGDTTDYDCDYRTMGVCPSCKRNGLVSTAPVWGNCVNTIHRGQVKDGAFRSTETCIGSRHDYLRSIK
jgi:hypothetical protein